MGELIFRGGTIVTLADDHTVTDGDLVIRDGVIAQVGGSYTPATRDYDIIDAGGCIVMPGLVQAHVHTCQTLARGRADDLDLHYWPENGAWPSDAAPDAPPKAAYARLAFAARP